MSNSCAVTSTVNMRIQHQLRPPFTPNTTRTLLSLRLDTPRADLDLNSSDRVHRVAPPQRLSTALRHANVIEQPFLHETCERADGVLDGIVVVYSGALEEVHAFLAAEGSVDGGDAPAEVFWPIQTL